MGRRVKSDFLVGNPSLVSGTARLFDFYGLFDEYNNSQTESQADAMAAFGDWMIVGQDIREAMKANEPLKNAA